MPSFEEYAMCSLHITHNTLEELQLYNLENIAAGDVYVAFNDNLCYVTKATFENVFADPNNQVAHVVNNNRNCGK